MKKTHAILVLGDEKTWDDMRGARICIITEEDLERLAKGDLRVEDIRPIVEMSLPKLIRRNYDNE